ncbi:MAG: type III secretion system cytoplasmic ring protein SctQ [Thiolinea sp.]
MNNRRQIKVAPFHPMHWAASAVRINNLLLNKSQTYSFNIDENRMFRLRLLPGETQRQVIYPIGITLGIGDSTAGLWLSDWPALENIREFIPEGMLARLPENLGLALTENAMEPLIASAENGLASKISLQSLSAEQNSRLYTLPVSFELLEANRAKPEGSNIRTVNGLLMLEERMYPLLQERMRFWPSDLNEDWENLETKLHIEIGQTELSIHEINTLAISDVLIPDNNDFQAEQLVRLRLTTELYCQAHLITDQNKILTITTGWNTMADNEPQNNIDQINKVPVQLSFDLGHKTLSFNEVKQLRPGYVLDLPANLPEVVQIKAQNKQIGSGELVEVDGRIGVRIISLFGNR